MLKTCYHLKKRKLKYSIPKSSLFLVNVMFMSHQSPQATVMTDDLQYITTELRIVLLAVSYIAVL